MSELVVLELVASEPEAEMLSSLLRSEGIPSMVRRTNFAVGAADGMPSIGGPREIVVNEEHLAEARRILDDQKKL